MSHNEHHPKLPRAAATVYELEELHEILQDVHDRLADILVKLDDIHETLRGD